MRRTLWLLVLLSSLSCDGTAFEPRERDYSLIEATAEGLVYAMSRDTLDGGWVRGPPIGGVSVRVEGVPIDPSNPLSSRWFSLGGGRTDSDGHFSVTYEVRCGNYRRFRLLATKAGYLDVAGNGLSCKEPQYNELSMYSDGAFGAP